jgi:glycine cleavage system H protein
MPVKGTILEINPQLDKNPELVNSDPYGDGWIIKVALSSAVENLLSADDYAGLVGH